MRLRGFMALSLPEWDWQAHDCCRWVDRWVQARGHASPIAALGLVYDSERSALRRITEGGGLLPLWTAGMSLVGVPSVDVAKAGDVAVIHRPTVDGLDQAMAICTGKRWVSLGLRGLIYGPAKPLRVWRP